MQKNLLLLLCVLGAVAMFAQPSDVERYGCHYRKKNAFRPEMTPALQARILASNSRSDTFDILHYNIHLDITSYASAKIAGSTAVTFAAKLPDVQQITLDLLGLTVDSIKTDDGTPLPFVHQGLSIVIDLMGAQPVGTARTVWVWYHGQPIQSPSGFGGVYFEENVIYNLSIGLSDDPHNFGHAWFPCFDNFVERSTYELSFTTTLPFRAFAVGNFVGEQAVPGNPTQVTRSFEMDLPLATYQVSFAASNFAPVQRVHTGVYGDQHPLLLLTKASDTTKTKTAFLPYLPNALDCFEGWYGRYVWDKVGYVMASRGAMENPGNTIFPAYLTDPANFESNLSIMSHELAHNWWGNVVTVGSEQDMWIKEGPAEYGAHLYFRHQYGHERFKQVLKGNTYTVLSKAHYDDGGFLPLSPMPHAVTYGTHTYNKGALVMHNLHTYLGDTLYSRGMKHLQSALGFQAMDAYEFRDTLSAFTGVDLTDFFADWVFSPGFSDFEIEKVTYAPLPNGKTSATVTINQKVRAAPHLHNNVPVEVNFRSEAGTVSNHSMMISGAAATATFELPFAPVMAYLNGNQSLNIGSLGWEKAIKLPGTINTTNVGMTLNVKSVPAGDSAWVRIDHHWVSPDVTPGLPATVRLGARHYWKVDGDWPAGFVTNGLIRYNRNTEAAELDGDLLAVTEDSLMVVWRPDGQSEWSRFPRQTILYVNSHLDGVGFARVDTMLKGEYALANGFFDSPVQVASVTDQPASLDVSPNPTDGAVMVFGQNLPTDASALVLRTVLGQIVSTTPVRTADGQLAEEISLEGLPAGMYLLEITDVAGRVMMGRKVERL